jgi:hypothetical protein
MFPLLLCLLLNLDDPPKDQPPKKPRVMELWFSKEHVPEKLQPGEKVNLKIVLASTTNSKGEKQMRLREFLRDLEVDSVDIRENPPEPWEAVFVKFKVNDQQAEQIRKIKNSIVTVQDAQTKKTTKRMVPLFVERVKKEGK